MKTITNLNIDEISVRTLEELAVVRAISMKELSVKIDESQHKRLKILAFSLGTSMSEIVRAVLQQLIDQYHKENVIDGEPESQD